MAGTATEYIQHHLTHLNNIGAKQGSIVDFSVFNFDTAVFSILMMLLAVWLMYSAAKKATSGVPGKWQCAVEMLVDMVSEQAKSIVHGDRTFIAPLALTVFVWVTLMNAIDLIPVDLIPAICGWFGIHYMRPLPTADLNGSMGISVGVLLLMIYYGIKIKGPAGFGKELFSETGRHLCGALSRSPCLPGACPALPGKRPGRIRRRTGRRRGASLPLRYRPWGR